MTSERPILIAGPTASGKSRLALELAERHRGVVINADSMQVYRELRILTARPTPDDETRAPHALYGHVAASDAYSVGRWIADAGIALAQARERGLRPIIVGGTGLYFKALREGLSAIPPIPADIRARWRVEAKVLGAQRLHARLAEQDAEMAARLAPTDTQRVTRALEVLTATGRSLADWQREPGTPLLRPEETDRLLVLPGRADLAARCDRRFDAMLKAGAMEEARRFLALELDPGLPAAGALGLRPLSMYIAGSLTLDQASELAKLETRKYAKRQLTWVRRHMRAWNVIVTQ